MHGQMHRDGEHWGASWTERPDNMGGTPWEYRERYIENSPYFFLDRVQTPVLLIHGERDTAVSVHLADELYVSLRRLHKEVQYARYASEGHLILQRSNGLDAAHRMIGWFDEHLGVTPP
jgi:dipeptidyl aminopeptidase/acylaminoacyl peptidase